METSLTIGALALALSAAQGEMAAAKKDAENPHFKSRYADLASIWDACRAPLARHRLAVIQTVSAQGDVVAITTMLAHESGEWVRDVLNLLPRDPSPQSAGSAITYGRRYALAAIVGVAPDDDDGNAASGNGARPSHAKPSTPVADKAPAAPSTPDDPVKSEAKRQVVKLAEYVGKAFATEVWESVKDWEQRRDELAKAINAAQEIVRVMGDGRGGELLTDIVRRNEPVCTRVASLVAASLGERVSLAPNASHH